MSNSRAEQIAVLMAGIETPDDLTEKELAEHREDLLVFLQREYDRAKGTPDGVPSDDWYRENAPNKDGELEIDDDAIVSRGEDSPGAYVQGWVWVDAPVCFDHDGEDEILPDHGAPCPVCRAQDLEDDDV